MVPNILNGLTHTVLLIDVECDCYGAVVNGKMAPLRQELLSGDIVKVLSSPSHKPSRDWLHFVKTSKAKNRIRHFIKAHQREADIQRGRIQLDRIWDRPMGHDVRLLRCDQPPQ